MAQSETLEASKAHYMNPASYDRFDHDRDFRLYELCIDPRNTNEEDMVVAYQTAGGVIGRGIDRAITDQALGGSPQSIERAIDAEADATTRGVIEGAHYNTCKLAVGMMAVVQEIAYPGDNTLAAYDAWRERYFETSSTAQEALKMTTAAAAQLLEFWDEAGYNNKADKRADQLVDMVNNRQLGFHNVMTMVDENRAGLYIVNHSATRGLRRASALRSEPPVADTAYHDSLGRTVNLIDYYMTDEERPIRTAAAMLRSAATRQVVAPPDSGIEYLEVMPVRSRQAVEVVAV